MAFDPELMRLLRDAPEMFARMVPTTPEELYQFVVDYGGRSQNMEALESVRFYCARDAAMKREVLAKLTELDAAYPLGDRNVVAEIRELLADRPVEMT